MTLQVISRRAQQSRIVEEAAEAVVAVRAQEGADAIAVVAVVDGKQLDLATSNKALGLVADSAKAVLLREHRRVLLGRDAIITLEISTAQACRPFNWISGFPKYFPILAAQESLLPLRGDEIFDPAIARTSISESEIAGRLCAFDVQPNEAVNEESFVAHGDISKPASPSLVPMPSDSSDLDIGKFWRVTPAKRERLGRVVVKKIADVLSRKIHGAHFSQRRFQWST